MGIDLTHSAESQYREAVMHAQLISCSMQDSINAPRSGHAITGSIQPNQQLSICDKVMNDLDSALCELDKAIDALYEKTRDLTTANEISVCAESSENQQPPDEEYPVLFDRLRAMRRRIEYHTSRLDILNVAIKM